MATIGTFTQTETGYEGTISTLTLRVACRLEAVENTGNDKAPDYRIVNEAGVDIGAAWRRTSKEDRPYMAVKLDDPALPGPVFASLVEQDGGHTLIWTR